MSPVRSKAYIYVEVCIVDVNPIGSLFEIQVGNANVVDIVAVNEPEVGARDSRLDQIRCCVFGGSAAFNLQDGGISLDLGSILILGLDDCTVGT